MHEEKNHLSYCIFIYPIFIDV